MQTNEERTWTFEKEAKVVIECLDAAEKMLTVEKRRLQALSEIRLAEHHIDSAGRLAGRLIHEEKLRKFRKRAADLRRRCGIVCRILGRLFQL